MVKDNGNKRPRSNSLEAAAAQALTQLDGPSHLRPHASGGFQPTLGPPQPMHPSQYANAFSAGQQANESVVFSAPQMTHSPDFRPNTGNTTPPIPGSQPGGSPAGGRAPGAHQARQRTAVACRYCRKRKIRCTGISHDPNDPRCSNCRRLDQECIYAPVGAPQGNYTRQPMPDAYARGAAFHPMPQPGMVPNPQWQGQPMGYPPQAHYMQYAQGRGGPMGPDGQHQFPQGQGYAPGPGYPGQSYQYDNSYPTYVSDPNAAQGHGQFGRLKPETFVVYHPPSQVNHQAQTSANAALVHSLDPAVVAQDQPDLHPLQGEQQVAQTDDQAVLAPELLDPKDEPKAVDTPVETTPTQEASAIEETATTSPTVQAYEPVDAASIEEPSSPARVEEPSGEEPAKDASAPTSNTDPVAGTTDANGSENRTEVDDAMLSRLN